MNSEAKELIFEESRQKLLNGINILADAVCFTLGPKGRNVGIEESFGAPRITNDGNSIVKEIVLQDQYENMGAEMAKEVATKIKEKSGDGTTTGTLLLRTLVKEGVKNIAAGSNPSEIKRGMDKALQIVLKELDAMSKPIKDQAAIRNIAIASASGSQEVGNFISEALEKTGKSGIVTIEEAKGTETTVEIVEGMQLERGYVSPYFCTSQDLMHVEMRNAALLITDKRINSIHEILPILQAIAPSGREFLIVADDLEGDALATLVINKLRGILKVAAIKAPGFGDRRKSLLQDMATLTGGIVISEEAGINLKDTTLDMLGTAEKIIITKEETIIVGGAGKKEELNQRIKQIEHEIQETVSSYDKEHLEERKAKLSGGVAIIRVGAPSETEMKQKKQLFEDSLNSTKAAEAEGVVPGGGVALFKARKALQKLKLAGDETLGAKIVETACLTPIKQIIYNSGHDGAVILAELDQSPLNMGFNAETEKVEDLVAAGVIDPTKVVKSSLTHAVSVAGIVLLSEALIGDAPKKDNDAK